MDKWREKQEKIKKIFLKYESLIINVLNSSDIDEVIEVNYNITHEFHELFHIKIGYFIEFNLECGNPSMLYLKTNDFYAKEVLRRTGNVLIELENYYDKLIELANECYKKVGEILDEYK